MKKYLLTSYFYLLYAIPLTGYCQELDSIVVLTNKGVKFEEKSKWEQIQAEAKEKNKFIFVDCYATWCTPCKMMDRDIYTSEEVGDFMNANFISIKIQIDTSSHDNEGVRNMYLDAQMISRQYRPTGFPTFLFFSPNGEIVHRSVGFKNVGEFIRLASNAKDSSKQYYTLKEQYLAGKMDTSRLRYLAQLAAESGDNGLLKGVCLDYIGNCLLRLKYDKLFTRDKIEFVFSCATFLNTKDSAFWIFYNNSKRINQIMKDSIWSQKFLDYVIAKEDIDPLLWADNKAISAYPDWRAINSFIARKYNKEYARRIVAFAKDRWYGWKENWQQLLKNKIFLVANYKEYISDFDMSVFAWTVFQHSTDSSQLNAATSWVQQLIRKDKIGTDVNAPNDIDTYANLLYKLGRKQTALKWEEQAARYAPNDSQIQGNLAKMKSGKPTWTLD